MRDKHGWEDRDFKHDGFSYFDGHTATAWMAWQDARFHLAQPPAQAERDSEAEREAFEAWASNQGGDIDKNKRGAYYCDETRARWHAWQARATLKGQQ